jgi:6-phosphofructokinase
LPEQSAIFDLANQGDRVPTMPIILQRSGFQARFGKSPRASQPLKAPTLSFFKAEGIPIVVRCFDPSYQVRSRPSNSEDALLCDLFARDAVHAAMAGRTGVVIGFLYERFIHVPIEHLATDTKRLDPASGCWRSVLATTGQPERFA